MPLQDSGFESVVAAELAKRGVQPPSTSRARFLGYRFKGFGQFDAMIEMKEGNIQYTSKDVCEAVARPANARSYAYEASTEALKYWPVEV